MESETTRHTVTSSHGGPPAGYDGLVTKKLSRRS